MTQTEALKLALECAERCESIDGMYSWADTITAIKEALAQPEQKKCDNCGEFGECCQAPPEQEPVAWELGAEVYWGDSPELSDYVRKEGTPLYTTPPQRTWVGLTDEELELLNSCGDTDSYKFAKSIESKLKEKNT